MSANGRVATNATRPPHLVVVMGPAGAGKTDVGRLVADRLRVPFLDADDFHAPADVDAMRRGIPLDDAHRRPWLERCNAALRAHRDTGAVLACSALKASYRTTLREGLPDLRFVALLTSRDELERRLKTRPGHFAGPALLDSQLDTLELTDDVAVVDAGLPKPDVADRVVDAIS